MKRRTFLRGLMASAAAIPLAACPTLAPAASRTGSNINRWGDCSPDHVGWLIGPGRGVYFVQNNTGRPVTIRVASGG